MIKVRCGSLRDLCATAEECLLTDYNQTRWRASYGPPNGEVFFYWQSGSFVNLAPESTKAYPTRKLQPINRRWSNPLRFTRLIFTDRLSAPGHISNNTNGRACAGPLSCLMRAIRTTGFSKCPITLDFVTTSKETHYFPSRRPSLILVAWIALLSAPVSSFTCMATGPG